MLAEGETAITLSEDPSWVVRRAAHKDGVQVFIIDGDWHKKAVIMSYPRYRALIEQAQEETP